MSTPSPHSGVWPPGVGVVVVVVVVVVGVVVMMTAAVVVVAVVVVVVATAFFATWHCKRHREDTCGFGKPKASDISTALFYIYAYIRERSARW